ncbi:MAG TPA: carboxymuconolactone decarboxylase family protein [Jiangellaceae bacterium]
MSRIPRLTPHELDADQQRLYAAITGGDRARGPQFFELTDSEGRLVGPFNAMLLNPPIGDALQRLGAAIRYGGRLPARCREIAILAVAAHWQCGFELRAHESIAAHAGLSATQIAALGNGEPVDFGDPVEAEVLRTTRHLLEHGSLDDDSYAAAASAIGPDKLFELTTLVGYYSLLALQMNAFAVR